MKHRKDAPLEVEIFLGKDELLPARLIIEAVPEDVYKKRISKAKIAAGSKGHQVSKLYKTKNRYNLFITNVKKEDLPAAKIRSAYKLRWNIEIIFKTWKSFLDLHKVKAVKKERLECQILSKFIWILINWNLFQIYNHTISLQFKGHACSLLKYFKRVKMYSYTLRQVLMNKLSLNDWLKSSYLPIVEHSITECKKDKIALYQIFDYLKTS